MTEFYHVGCELSFIPLWNFVSDYAPCWTFATSRELNNKNFRCFFDCTESGNQAVADSVL